MENHTARQSHCRDAAITPHMTNVASNETVQLAAAVFNIPTMMNRYYWDITLMVNETVSKYLLNYGSIFLLHTTTVD